MHRWIAGLAGSIVVCGLAGCAGNSNNGTSVPPIVFGPLTLSLAALSLQIFPGEGSATVAFTVTGGATTVPLVPKILNAPPGLTETYQGSFNGIPGSIAIGATIAAPGTYSLTVSVSDGTKTVTAPLTLNVGVTAVVSPTTAGTFQEAMSTSFQVAPYNDSLMTSYPTIPALLTTLAPNHTRMQVLSTDIPETAPGVWDFTTLDGTVQPILSAADHSPEFQIAAAPQYLYQGQTSNFVNAAFVAGYADYAAHLVQYYNKGGFMANGTHYQSPSANPIKYWGIWNEPNYSGISPSDYVTLYNAAVPAMLAVDPTIKIVALELGGGYQSPDQSYVPPFVQGVTAQVDVLATHYYSTCQQSDTDATLMATIPNFAADAQYLYSLMQPNPALKSVPVWVLENNVNADYAIAGGKSMCNPSIDFVDDARGSSAFFAAWRPYIFSQLGKANVQALYHWAFAADPQYGEVNVDQPTLFVQLSYWVDYWIGQLYPADTASTILSSTDTDPGNVEVLAIKQASGKVVVMICDHAVANATDNNGAGVPKVVELDLSALGTFSTASQLTIDASTNPATGPTPQNVTYASKMQFTMRGYGVTFLTLQ